LRDMKVDDPKRKDEDLLEAMQIAVAQKKRQLQRKRSHSMVDPAAPDEALTSYGSDIAPLSPPSKRRFSRETTRNSDSGLNDRDTDADAGKPLSVEPDHGDLALSLQFDKDLSSTKTTWHANIDIDANVEWGSFVNELLANGPIDPYTWSQ
jgi:hypothetical protein